MNHEALGTLMDKWTNDAGFRAAVRQDPQTAIAAAGVVLSEEEMAAVAAVDWSLTDAELAVQTKIII